MTSSTIHAVKVGGSLLDLPDLPVRLRRFVDELVNERVVMVVGGGRAADLVRDFDKTHKLDESDGHWLAVRAMQLNTHMLATQLPEAQLVAGPEACHAAWNLVDPLAWLERDDRGVPHRWTFTSDSITAHIATQLGATHLTLLKSTLPKSDCGVACAAGLCIVDEDLEDASRDVPHIELVNLRAQPPASCVLKDEL